MIGSSNRSNAAYALDRKRIECKCQEWSHTLSLSLSHTHTHTHTHPTFSLALMPIETELCTLKNAFHLKAIKKWKDELNRLLTKITYVWIFRLTWIMNDLFSTFRTLCKVAEWVKNKVRDCGDYKQEKLYFNWYFMNYI